MYIFMIDITPMLNQNLTRLHLSLFGRIEKWRLVHVIIFIQIEAIFENSFQKIDFA